MKDLQTFAGMWSIGMVAIFGFWVAVRLASAIVTIYRRMTRKP